MAGSKGRVRVRLLVAAAVRLAAAAVILAGLLSLPFLQLPDMVAYKNHVPADQRVLARAVCGEDGDELQWYACAIGARWLLSRIPPGREPPVVGLYEAAVDPDHPDLRVEGGLPEGVLPFWAGRVARMGHGGGVAGVIGGGRRSEGMIGLAPNARLVPFSYVGGGDRSIDAALDYFSRRGVKVASFAFIGDTATQEAVAAAVAGGLLPVGSFSNDEGNYSSGTPALRQGFLAVVALGPDGQPLPHGYGPAADVAVSAPSPLGPVATPRLGPLGWGSPYGYGICCNSAAVAVGAGAAALLSWYDPTLTGPQIHKRLLLSAKPLSPEGWTPRSGHGRIDLRAAAEFDRSGPVVELARGGGQITGQALDDIARIKGSRERDLPLQSLPTSAIAAVEASFQGPSGPWKDVPFRIGGGSALDPASYRAVFELPDTPFWLRARDSSGNWGPVRQWP